MYVFDSGSQRSIGYICDWRMRTEIRERVVIYLPRICLSRCAFAATGSIEGHRYIDLGSAAGDLRIECNADVDPRGSE